MDKVLYVLGHDPNDRRSWSGICFSCNEQLRRHFDVDTLYVRNNLVDKLLWGIFKTLSVFRKKKLIYNHSLIRAKLAGRRINRFLKRVGDSQYKAIFLIGSPLGAYMKTDRPVMYFSDAVFHQMVGYYYNVAPHIEKTADIIEKRALDNSTWVMLASDWAKECAVNYYKVPEGKCLIGKFGANVDTTEFRRKKETGTVNLLFVGVDWERKGGDIAVECVRELTKIDKSRKYKLHLVGVMPPYQIHDENIFVYGFLNRNVPEQRTILTELREKADLFLLPTKAECAGIVFCESSAYGIPSVTYDTGGIGSYVINGENGYRMPMGSTGRDFANKIKAIMDDGELYQYMCGRCVELYRSDMNWNALGDRIRDTIYGR